MARVDGKWLIRGQFLWRARAGAAVFEGH